MGINGSTGAVLGRSLMGLRDLVESTLSDIRIAANEQRRDRILVVPFLKDIAVAGCLHAEARGIKFTTELGDPAMAITADPQILASAVTNLLNNAFKFTPAGGHVVLRARTNEEARLLIEVADECGGIPSTEADPFQAFGVRRGRDRTGLGLGLSIARKAVRAHGGDIHMENLWEGCVFVIDVARRPVLAVSDTLRTLGENGPNRGHVGPSELLGLLFKPRAAVTSSFRG